MPLETPAFTPLKFKLASLRKLVPALSAVLVFVASFLAGRALLDRRTARPAAQVAPPAGAGLQPGVLLAKSAAATSKPSVEEASVSQAAPAKRADPRPPPGSPDQVPAGGAATTAATTTATRESEPAAPRPDSSGPDLSPTYEVKGKQSVTVVARMYVTRTAFMTVADLEAAIRSANGGKTDAYFKKGDRVVIPGFLTEPIVEKPVAIDPGTEMRGIYLTGYTAGSAKGIELIRRWHAAGGNAVVFDIKDFDGLVGVPFHHPLTSTRRPLISNLPKFARFLHSLGLHSIGRIALFRDAYQAENHSRLAVRSRRSGKPWLENGKLAWVDPSNPEIQSYLLALARTAASSGLDEIQFDYVRFPAEGDQKDAEFAYETVHPKWQRSDVIVDFLDRAYRELHPLGVLLSLDVFGVMAWQRSVDLAHTGQDITAMAHHCDILSPMIYPSHFFNMDGYKKPGDYPQHFIGESMERFHAITADSKVVLRPWLQAFAWRTSIYSPAYIVVQVSTSNQKGGVGYLFWNARNDYSKLFPAMPRLRSDANPKNAAMAPPGRSQGHTTGGDREAAHAGPSEP